MCRSDNPTADTSQSAVKIHNLRNAEPQEEELVRWSGKNGSLVNRSPGECSSFNSVGHEFLYVRNWCSTTERRIEECISRNYCFGGNHHRCVCRLPAVEASARHDTHYFGEMRSQSGPRRAASFSTVRDSLQLSFRWERGS